MILIIKKELAVSRILVRVSFRKTINSQEMFEITLLIELNLAQVCNAAKCMRDSRSVKLNYYTDIPLLLAVEVFSIQ